MAIPFVDAHIHLWELDRLRYAWLSPPFDDAGPNGSVEPIAKNYGIDDYLADAARWNMVGAVHVDAGADAAHAYDETLWLEGLAADRGLPSAIVAFAALDDPQVEALLMRHAQHRHVRGIRHIVNWHPDPMRSYTPRDATQDAQWQKGFAALATYGLSFDLQCYPGQMPGLAPVIGANSDVPVIINHMGMPVMTDADGLEDWRKGLRALAAYEHVSIKISGLGFIWRDWSPERVRPLILEAIDLFGTHRCMFASDTPTDKLFAPFDRYMETYHDIAAAFSEDARRDLFGRNANRIYRIGLDI
jgi:predicted TIM-barrel fold metal-dependent hydrolase